MYFEYILSFFFVASLSIQKETEHMLTANGVRKLSYITEIARYTPLEVTLFLPSHVVESFLD